MDAAATHATTKSERTRALIRDVALKSFRERGYDATTIRLIAQDAGISVGTTNYHFASKNDLASALDQSYLERFVEEVQQRGPNTDILSLWRDWIDRSSRELTHNRAEGYRKSLRRRWANSTTPTNMMRLWSQYEDLLTRELARDFGVDPENDSLPRLVACMLWAGNVNAARRWAHAQTGRTLNEECVAVVDDVIALFGDRIKRPASRRPKRMR